jgi:hypothetical protein
MRRAVVNSVGNYQLYHDPLSAGDWLLMENGEMEARADVNGFDIARLNQITGIVTQFIKYVEGNFILSFDIFPVLQKLFVNLGSLHAKGSEVWGGRHHVKCEIYIKFVTEGIFCRVRWFTTIG